MRPARLMVLAVAALLTGCGYVRPPEAQMVHDAREKLEHVASGVEGAAARSESPWRADYGSVISGPSGSATVYAWSRQGRSSDLVLRVVGLSRRWMDDQSTRFGACLRVNWTAQSRRVAQIPCSLRVLADSEQPIDDELMFRDSPNLVPRVSQGPCDPPTSKSMYEQCGG